MTKPWIKLKDFFTFNFFREMEDQDVPFWVRRVANSYFGSGVRPYNKVVYVKGNHRVYKIWFETLGQANIKDHFYCKWRTY